MKTLLNVILLSCLTAANSVYGLSLQQFRDCVSAAGAGYGSTCTLDPGSFGLTDTIVVGRSNITIEGSGLGTTTVYRAAATLQKMIMPAPYVTNVTMRYLTLDGRRWDFGSALNCLPANREWAELDWRALGSDGLYHAGSPTGTLTAHDIVVINAPADGVQLGGQASTLSYVFIGTDQYTSHIPSRATRSSGVLLRGYQAGVYYSHIYYSGTAAVAVHGCGTGGSVPEPYCSHQFVYGNDIFSNRYEQSDPAGGGGQVYLEGPDVAQSYSNGVSVAANTIDGNNWRASSWVNGCFVQQPNPAGGMEVNGYNHGLYNNSIFRNSSGGMGIGGGNVAKNITVTTDNPWVPGESPRSIRDNGYHGITVLGTAHGHPYNVEGIKLTRLYMSNNVNHAVWFDYNTVGVNGPGSFAVGFDPTGTHHICGTSGWEGPTSPPPPWILYPGTYNGGPFNNVCP